MELKEKNVLVIGSGISGIAAVKLLERAGAKPVLYDGNDKLTKEEILERFQNGTKAEICIGAMTKEIEDKTELVVISPGVPVDLPMLDAFRNRGIRVWGEIELAYQFAKGRMIAITGTNGKTTTTALTGQIMKDYFKEVYVVGNIGNPYTDIAYDTTENAVTVAEISSFQLETVEDFHAEVAAILNITPDHLNRHHTMECYVETKEKISLNQNEADTIVLNYDDAYTRAFGKRTNASVVYFSRMERLEKGVYVENGEIMYADGEKSIPVIKISQMQLLGSHNVENVMAAIGMSISFGVPVENIRETIKNFKAVEHRIEFVREVNGVAYYNDSKGTNVDAAIKGIAAMERKTVLIGGGYDKQSEYDEWIEAFDGKVKCLVLIGQTAEKIAACARKHGFENIVMAEDLKEAVRICDEKTEPGDAVLLSPACASWGMFKNYEQRGTMFKELVNQL